MSDFMPFLILAGAIGMVELWRRLETRSARSRRYALGGIVALAAFSLVANIAIATEPSPQWNEHQLTQYLTAAKSLSVQSLASTVHHAATLPYWAPEGQLYVVGDCSGLYYSTGQSYKDVPGQQLMHWTWLPVQQARGIVHTIDVTINERQRDITRPVPILSYGGATLYLEQGTDENVQLQVTGAGARAIAFPSATGGAYPVFNHVTYQFQVITDPNMNAIEVWQGGHKILGHYLPGPGPAHVLATSAGGTTRPIVVVDATQQGQPLVGLCRSLLRGT
jgi:hypothetical protein